MLARYTYHARLTLSHAHAPFTREHAQEVCVGSLDTLLSRVVSNAGTRIVRSNRLAYCSKQSINTNNCCEILSITSSVTRKASNKSLSCALTHSSFFRCVCIVWNVFVTTSVVIWLSTHFLLCVVPFLTWIVSTQEV